MRLDYETILRQSFKKSLRGYSEEEVRDFLKIVAKDFKEMKQDLARITWDVSLAILSISSFISRVELRRRCIVCMVESAIALGLIVS